MKDFRLSPIDLGSATLSLRSTSLMLMRFSSSSGIDFGIDFDIGNVVIVGGLGKSDALVESKLVPRVLSEAWLLLSMAAVKPKLLAPLLWLQLFFELWRGINPPALMPSPASTPPWDCPRLRSRKRLMARFVGDVWDSCLETLAISVGTEKLS